MAAFHYDPESDYRPLQRIPRKTDRVRRNITPKRQPGDLRPSVLVARRQISTPDKKRIGAIVRTALNELSPDISAKLTEIERKGFTLVTSSEVQSLYRANYLQSGVEAPRNFVGGVSRLAESMSSTNPLVFAKLGNISVCGDTEDDRSRKKFVAMDLLEADPDVLDDERERLITSLLPPNASEDYKNDLLAKQPHISLVKTHNEKAAQRLAEKLSGTELVGAWVALGKMDTVRIEVSVPSRSRSS